MDKNPGKNTSDSTSGTRVEEVEVPYSDTPIHYNVPIRNPKPEDFSYSLFKAILDKSPFTIGEWAKLLAISERTLHRYAREDASFNNLQIERILLLEEFIDTGNNVFGRDGLKRWVHSSPFSLGGDTVFDCLFTHQGIQSVIDTLHRIQYGAPA